MRSFYAFVNQPLFTAYLQWIRWDKPVGTGLLLWPVLWALELASNGSPPVHSVLVFLTGVVCMRALGAAINDYADQDFDKKISRTQNRPLANGSLTLSQAHIGLAVLGGLAASLLFFLQTQTILYAILAFLLTAMYPFMKRVTFFPQVVLGLAFGISVPMVFSELTGTAWHASSVWLYAAVVYWVLAYDTTYACLDASEDPQAGVHSIATWFLQLRSPQRVRYLQTAITACNVLFLCCWLTAVYHQAPNLVLQSPYLWVAFICAASGIALQHRAFSAEKTGHLQAIFRSHNILGAVLFAGLWVSYARG